MTTGNLASIDLGSNSCRLRIVDDKSVLLYNDSKATNLAEGLFETGSLTENAKIKTLETDIFLNISSYNPYIHSTRAL